MGCDGEQLRLGGSVEDVARIAEELQAFGVDAQVRQDHPGGEPWADAVAYRAQAPIQQTASLSFHNRDTERVRAVLQAHGLGLPDLPW